MAETMEVDAYRTRFANIREGLASHVDGGMSLIDELLKELSDTRTTLGQTKLDLDNECQARRRLQQEAHENKIWKEKLGNRPFVVVLIDADADSYVLHDKFINMGEKGGENAADALLAALQQFLRDVAGVPNGVDIVLKAFANVSGLGRALERDRRVHDVGQLREFTTGFNNRRAFFDFVDIGAGKERADSKIRDSVKFFLDSFQCKHLVVACGHDTGYAPFLGQIAAEKQIAERVTLLEGGIPFPKAIEDLGFNTTRFDSIFNDHVNPMTWANLARPVTGREVTSKTAGVFSNGKISSEAPVAVVPGPMMRPKASPGGCYRPEVQSGRLGPILRDKQGWRMDRPLSVNPAVKERLKKRGLCFYLFLRGECLKPCRKTHGYPPLSNEEYDALWLLAREGGLCFVRKRAGQNANDDCSDVKCVYGHDSRAGHEG